MQRLTEKDELGNWCLKGVRWEQLRSVASRPGNHQRSK